MKDLRATNRWEAIDELMTVLAGTGQSKSDDRDVIIGAVGRRESSMSIDLAGSGCRQSGAAGRRDESAVLI